MPFLVIYGRIPAGLDTVQVPFRMQQTKNFSIASLLLISLGAALEYYDYVVYLFCAPFFSASFFPSISHHGAMLQSTMVFFLGAVLRPLSGYLWGKNADTKGRGRAFSKLVLMMSAVTVALALCPTMASVGLWATFLFMSLRLGQSMLCGADLPCSIVFVAACSPSHRKASCCGVVVMMVGIGSAIAAGVCYGLSKMLGTDAMATIGWRIAFLIGAALGFLSYLARRRLVLDEEIKPSQSAKNLFSKHKSAIVSGLFLMALPCAMVTLGTCFPILLHSGYGFDAKAVYHSVFVASLVEAPIILASAMISDKIGSKRMFKLINSTALLLLPILFLQLHYWHALSALYVFVFGFHLVLGSLAGCFFVLLCAFFKGPAQTQLYGFTYNMAYVIMSLLPFVVTLLLHVLYFDLWLVLIMLGLALISFIGLARFHPEASADSLL